MRIIAQGVPVALGAEVGTTGGAGTCAWPPPNGNWGTSGDGMAGGMVGGAAFADPELSGRPAVGNDSPKALLLLTPPATILVYSLGPAGVDEPKANPLSSGEKTRVAPSDSERNENRKSAPLAAALFWKGGGAGTSPETFPGQETGSDTDGPFSPADPALFDSKLFVAPSSGLYALEILLRAPVPSKN